MIKNKIILFDLHGVLIEFSFLELIKSFLKYNKKLDLVICFLDPRIIYKTIYLIFTEKVVEKSALVLIEKFPKLNKQITKSNFLLYFRKLFISSRNENS